MTKRISKEVKQRIHELHGQGSSVKYILSILKLEHSNYLREDGIYRILKENTEDDTVNNKTFASITEDVFNESFISITKEDIKDIYEGKQGRQEGRQRVCRRI